VFHGARQGGGAASWKIDQRPRRTAAAFWREMPMKIFPNDAARSDTLLAAELFWAPSTNAVFCSGAPPSRWLIFL
jgi:hypothetical protein